MLIFEALQPARRDVVLDQRRGLVPLWFSRKPFSHFVVFPGDSSICPRISPPNQQDLLNNPGQILLTDKFLDRFRAGRKDANSVGLFREFDQPLLM